MADQAARAAAFRALHVPGHPLVLFNIWDAGSARVVAGAGARALGTGSWSVAAAHGFADGEALPLDLAIANLRRIVGATPLPVSIDLEGGYGGAPGEVGRTVALALDAGAAGCNIEDSLPTDRSLRPTAEAAARLAAARSAADAAALFINARTDVFLAAPAAAHDAATVEAALERAGAYADAGADGLFVPGLADDRLIGLLVERSPLPVNIMMSPGVPPLARLARLGVARVSHGPGPYAAVMGMLGEEAGRAAIDRPQA